MLYTTQFRDVLLRSAVQTVWLVSVTPHPDLGLPSNVVIRLNSSAIDYVDSNGVTWYGGYLVSHDAQQTAQTGSTGNSALTLNFNRSHPSLTGLNALLYSPEPWEIGLYDNATVVRRMLVSPFTAPTDNASIVLYGYVGDISLEGNELSVDIRGAAEPLASSRSSIVSKFCPYRFGDSRCGVTPPTSSETVLSSPTANPQALLVTNVGGFDPAWLAQGVLRITQYFGADRVDVGYPYSIAYAQANGFDLWVYLDRQLVRVLSVADRVSLQPGCNKSTEDCIRYGNLRRHGGFPVLPGNLRIYNRVGN